ncbi:MAG: hypothetical protein CMB31_02825 [Euryarchaeota archaeon]|nr:hypothetical protein [Euryarchaeota archaeon]
MVCGDFLDVGSVLVDLHEEDKCNGGGYMISTKTVATEIHDDLASRWYVPAEVESLRKLYPIVVLINFVSLGIFVLRNDSESIFSSSMQIVVSIVILFLLSKLDQGQRFIRDGVIAISGLTILLSVLQFSSGPQIIIDYWMMLWTTIPPLLVIYSVSKPIVTLWASGNQTVRSAELGLFRNRKVSRIHGMIFRHIALLHAVGFVVLPILWIIDVAVSPGNSLGGDFFDAMTLEHFNHILSSESFWIWTRNSIIVSVGTTLLGLALAIPAGYAFSRFKFRGRDFAMFSFLLVQMFPGVIILVPYFLVMKALGLLNTSIGLILAYSVTALPLCVWMLKGFFDTVPKELEEAALVDGCNQNQVFWRIILPLSLPAVAVTALFSFLAAWNEFLLALTFNTSEEMYTLPVGLASLISSTGQAWGDFAAASLLVSLPVVVLFIAFQRFLIEGLSAGGVKG